MCLYISLSLLAFAGVLFDPLYFNLIMFFFIIFVTEVIYKLYVVYTDINNSTVMEADCEVSLRFSSRQPPGKNVKCVWLQPRMEPVT